MSETDSAAPVDRLVMPAITFQRGSDYVAIWVGDEQVYCYHGRVEACLKAVVNALGGEVTVTEFEEGDDFDWDYIEEMSLPEFRELCRDAREAWLEVELREAEAKVRELKDRLKQVEA